MKNQLILAVLVTAVAGTACKKSSSLPATDASFTFTGDNKAAPAKVLFNNTSNGISYQWDFGDGKTSSEDDPEHIYEAAGTYTVKLTAQGSNNASITKTVVVKPAHTQVKTTYVKILSLPAKSGGWDNDGTGPDLYFKIVDGSSTLVNASANRINDVAALPVQWNFTSPFTQAIATTTKIQVFDYDTIVDEAIGEILFPPGYFTSYVTWDEVYPAKISIPYNGLTIELGLQWQ